jgi:hypothetical protein
LKVRGAAQRFPATNGRRPPPLLTLRKSESEFFSSLLFFVPDQNFTAGGLSEPSAALKNGRSLKPAKFATITVGNERRSVL